MEVHLQLKLTNRKLSYSLFEEYQVKAKGIEEKSTLDIESNLDNLNVRNFLSDYNSFVKETIEIQTKYKLHLYLDEKVLPRSEKQMGSNIQLCRKLLRMF